MNSSDPLFVRKEISRILEKVFALPQNSLATDEVELAAHDWDSLKQIQIILELEDAFGLDLSELEASQIRNFESIFSLISKMKA